MENWKKDSRKDIVMVDVDALVPPDHLLRKVERVMDYDWLYERLSPYSIPLFSIIPEEPRCWRGSLTS